MAGISIRNATRRPVAGRRVFSQAARAVLPGWDVSLAFVGPARAKALNKRLRGKAYVPNVLSYQSGDRSAEVIICPAEAARQAPTYGMRVRTFTLHLFIHGLLHIKGWAHGATMERCERILLERFSYEAAHRHRHRHRDVPGKDGRRRGTLR